MRPWKWKLSRLSDSVRTRKRSNIAPSASSFGISLVAPYSDDSGTWRLALPVKNRRSLRMLSSEFRIAEFDLKISSRNTMSASGNIASTRRT